MLRKLSKMEGCTTKVCPFYLYECLFWPSTETVSTFHDSNIKTILILSWQTIFSSNVLPMHIDVKKAAFTHETRIIVNSRSQTVGEQPTENTWHFINR